MKGKSKTQKGITLVALIITIVVLLILAVVAINAISDTDLVGKANTAATMYNNSVANEQGKLQNYVGILDSAISGSGLGGGTSTTTDQLAGRWVFKVQPIITADAQWTVAFTSNGTSYTTLKHVAREAYMDEEGAPGTGAMYYGSTWIYGGGLSYDGSGAGDYQNSSYTVITITSKLSEVENGEALLIWLGNNATKLTPLSKPVIALSGDTLTIQPVANATSYDIYAGNELKKNVTTTTVDLKTLYLNAGNYQITVKAKANGYEDSEASNAVTYAAPEPTVTLAGTWVLNPDPIVEITGEWAVSFTSNNTSYSSFKLVDYLWDVGRPGTGDIYYNTTNIYYGFYDGEWPNSGDSWTFTYENSPYTTITITSNLADVTNGVQLLTWLQANATKQ